MKEDCKICPMIYKDKRSKTLKKYINIKGIFTKII